MAICTGFGRHGSGPCPIVPYLCLSVDVSVDRLCVCACAQEHSARDKRSVMGVQVKVLEKRIDSLLQHWRTRIGIDRKVPLTPNPTPTPPPPPNCARTPALLASIVVLVLVRSSIRN